MPAQVVSTSAGSKGAQQKDNLCGPFWAARVLAEAGFTEWAGESIDEDLIAIRAGTVLPDSNMESALPPGAMSRASYKYELPVASIEASGTSPRALMQAIEQASAGVLRCIPIRGQWTAERVERLVDEAPKLSARLLANLRSGLLWGSRPPLDVLLDELAGRPVKAPAADWDVGHFVELEMLIRGPQRALVVVHDSYPTLGSDGRHLQPPRAIAAALLRGDGREGGVVAVMRREKADATAALVAGLGLDIGVWNNGTGG